MKLASTSPDIISTSPKNVLTRRIDFTVLLLFKFNPQKNITCPSGKLKTEFTGPIEKFTSPGLLDTLSLHAAKLYLAPFVSVIAWYQKSSDHPS